MPVTPPAIPSMFLIAVLASSVYVPTALVDNACVVSPAALARPQKTDESCVFGTIGLYTFVPVFISEVVAASMIVYPFDSFNPLTPL